jgi:amino acid adenylation domain-containing protein
MTATLSIAERERILEMARAARLKRSAPKGSPVVPVERTGALPLSFAQERLWLIDRLEPGSAVYNLPMAWRLGGALDQAALERSLGEIVRRHEALRTVFAEVNGAPVQVAAPFGGFSLPVEDLSGMGEADREATVRRRAGEEARRGFDLAAGPLFRTALLRLGAEDHVLLLSMHHIVSDEWSTGVFFRELWALYEAFLEGRESPLPELAVQYADYAVWQREQFAGEVLDRQLAYWRERLGDAPALLELPTDHPRPAVQTFRGATVPVELSAKLLERLQVLGRGEGATLYMTLLGAFQVLLSKYSGGDDVVVGSPIAGRTRGEVEELIGFFVNTLALRTDLSGDPSFREVLGRVREATLGAYEHQELPFERLVAELQPERSLSHSPLFQVMFTLQTAGGGGGAPAGLEVRGVGAELESAKFDLSLTLAASDQGLRGGLTYSTDLFERDTVERMLGHLARVLEQVAADADVRLSRLELLGEPERALVLEEWNRTERPYPRGVCIHELFDAQVRERPDAVALAWGEESLTYREVEARANQLANHLVRLGVGPEARVGVMLERGVELVVSLLAVLKAGGCYVPLDPGYPAERLRLMLEDSGVRVLLTRGDLAGAVEGVVETGGLDVVHLDRDAGTIASEPMDAPRGGATAENLAYIVYTSGSTGRPKGVMVGHRQVVQLVVETDYVQLRPGDRVAQASNAGFDALTFEVWGAFLNGATLVGIPQDVLLSPAALRQVLREERITTVFLTTALVNQLSHEAPDVFATVREVLFGGQAVDADSVRRLLKAGGPERLLHMYGPTETTTFCLYEEVEYVAEDALSVPLGHATGNQRIYLLDGALGPVPRGVPGEAYVGGGGVARGYLDRPGLTAERFVPDPFSTEPGARMYRTGDRMRWRGERKLEFVGRLDEQVKIRGFRIEPGEVESALSAHAAVREARVVVREDVPGDKRLVAYVLGEVEADDLREHVRGILPDYMVPSAFLFLDALPLTPNGKLDVKALPAPELASGEEAYVAPRTPTEEVLAGVWAELLRLERVGAEQSFFDLGGHSLLATRVVSRIREVFGVELPLRAVFERPVLRELAAEIDRLRGSGAGAGEGAIGPAAREGDLPVTFAQERLWFVDALDPGSPAYAMPFTYHVAGDLDDDALRRALAELVRRHEPLRTTLPAVDGVPVQRIAPPPASFDLPVADLRHLPEDERRAEADRLAAEASQHRFDLARGPLFRASLVRVADDEHLLLLNLHHAIGDGWTLGVLREELSALYVAFSRGEASPLPEPALQYADFAVWQRERLSGAALERQLEFWRRALDGAPALLELPTDRPRPPVESHRGGIERMTVSSGVAAEVNALARREGATLFMVLLAALDVVLGRLAGQEDVVVGTPIAGRTRAETDRMVGLFLNSLALRTDLSGDPSFRELLGRVRETTLGAYAHQDLPFERVLEEVRPERSLAHAPVFQVMLNLANFQDGAFRAEGLEVAGAGTGGEVASKFDLTLYVGERDGGIDVIVVYAADLFDARRMRGLLAQLEGVLRQAAAAPETRVGALSLATEAARGLLPDPAEPLDESWRGAVHEVFAARAVATPDALAVEDPRERWTYAELDAATNAIARKLAAHGVGLDDVVAITGHRSAALVRALLGTMKSGAAFLVLDPSYPAARLAEYVRIARPAAHIHLAAAGDLPREAVDLLDEIIRTRVVLHPRGDASAEDVDGLGAAGEAPRIDIGADTLAYLSFTSGTTGTPKAVMGRHSSLTHFTPWLAAEFGLSASDRFSLLSGLAHDPLHRDVFTPLQLGAAVVAPEPDEVGTPGYLARWMREAGVTVAHLTPAMGQLLADASEGERIDSLRRAFFVGDVLRRADVQRLVDLAPSLTVVNYYGSTETQRAVSYHVVDPAAEQKEIIPLGRGIPGVQLLVCNAAGELAGVGEVGEIWLRSPHLAAGYLGDAALSESRFVVSPWTAGERDRLYRTGDLGRYRPDGEVEPMGRADQQVKVRGFRVELGEVESALAAHPAIREAAVITRETEGGDRRLVAYWVPADDAARAESAELRTHLKALLPEYMVPSAYVRLDRLPLTANGKLDRRALPEPEVVASESRPAAPRTPTEEILAQLWAEVLRTESVGVDDDFFALGGHSLLATRLLARVQNALGVVVPLRALFEGPTVAELAGRVEEVRRAGLPALPPVVPVDRDRPLPLSFAQERLWFLDQLERGSASYNLPAALRLAGALDEAALERALGEIVRRHEVLRTVFHEVDGGAVQVVAPFAGFALPVDDLSGLSETAREAEVRRRAREDAARPFDLAEGPLFRAALLRLADEEHVLLVCLHHIVFDGWSSGVLFRELGALYAAFARGEPAPLPPLPVQYADFAVWQREQLAGEALDRQLAYWKARLAGAPALLELPTDRPRPAVQSHQGARETFDLPRALLDRLQALGRSEGATLYMVMLSAFQLLLSRYSGSEDVVVGSPIAGRTRKEVEELIGFFANTLVLRTDLSGDPSFRELLGRVREGTLGAYEHQEVPFERLVAELQPKRSMGHSPLFQVMFALQNADRSGFGVEGLRMEGVGAELETTKFDLGLTAVPHDGGVHGTLEYSTALFDRATVRRMLGHLERVLEQVAADADVRLSCLVLAGPEERARVVVEWNRTERPYPRGVCIHELFDAQVRERPDAVALVWGEESLTYRELDARANQLANHLVRLGVGPDVRVGVLLERSAELIVSILAVLKAGGAYVPLDPGYPAERLRLMLSDSSVRVLLSRSELAEVVEAHDLAVVHLDQAAGALASESTEAPRSGATPENLAYIVYTSGSTGKPKGVMVAHRHVVQLVCETDYVRFGPGDRVAQASNASFDALTFEAWGALMNGATLVGIPRDVLLSPSALREMLREERITTLYQTTALLNQLSREQPDVFAPLRDVLFGGQAADADSVRRLLKAGGPERLLHMYGPTETTAWCSWEKVEQVAEDALTVSVGRATGNQRIYLLDSVLNPVPVGVPGEAYVGGDGVVRGYLDRPGLTAERFLPDPFASEPGARMYRTGDRLRWKADGKLEFIGRVDEQVKIRGFRIEPGEIEAVLSAHAEVREARVIVREDEPGEQRLVAYVVGEAGADALREHLRESLPEYMVPAAFVALERIPLTPNGKLDVKALPAPEGDAYGQRSYEAPLGAVEAALAAIWGEVLGAERVGRWDHFFELGGHSLLAVRVVSRVRQALGLEAAVGDVFVRPVLADFARGLETAARTEAPAITPVDRTRPIPLSFAQQRLWFLEQLGDMGSTYHIPARLRLKGELDRDALAFALDRIVARHEALRTTFAEVNGVPEQRIAPAEANGFTLVEHDLGGVADSEAALHALLSEEMRAPFDLERGPLIRGCLIRLAADDHVLLVTMHHIVSDGWSMGVLFAELSALYAAHVQGREADLSELPIQYADYAAWQRGWIRGELLERQASYWEWALAGAPELLELPTDRARPQKQDFAGGSVAVELDAALTAALTALSQRHGTTLFMTLLAGWATVLARLSGQADVVIGTPSANRGHAEIEGLIGFFVNTLALRVDLSAGPTVAELLGQVRARALEGQRNQDIPFEQVVERLRPSRSLAHTPLFQVVFEWQNAAGGGALELPGLTLAPAGSATSVTAKYDLQLSLWEGGGRIAGAVQYATSLFDRATVERHVGYLRRVLEEMAADDAKPVGRLDLLSPAERRRVVEEWNATDAGYPTGACVHDLFRAQAARTPDAVALSWRGERVTYAELEARANGISNALRRRGVGPEVRVGICLPRTPDLVAAMLGVLKAGGAYVPLDPAYPRERLGYMLEDAGVALVVTDSALADRLPESAAALLLLDVERDAIAAESADEPESGVLPENLSHVIFTSGSTGRPKGVMIRHSSVAILLHWLRENVTDEERSSVLFSTSINFDVSIAEVFGTLAWGGKLVIVENALELATVSEPVVYASMVPSAAAELLQSGGIPASVRTLNLGGEALPNALAQGLYGLGTVEKVGNLYGPTEDTTYSTYSLVGRGADQVFVGRPVANTRAYVLDDHLQPVPAGAVGELYLAGDGLSRGYANRPGMTAERFVPCPFGPPGARMYRVMDRVRWKCVSAEVRECGSEQPADSRTDALTHSRTPVLEYLGRTDFQVKVRGYRIELGEIEARLAEHPGVRAPVVLVREDAPGDRRLVAYYLGDAPVAVDALKSHLSDRLPGYMVPAAYVWMKAYPLTPNGKVDRRALSAPEGDAYAAHAYAAPVDETEQAVAGIWAEVLGVERVGRHDDFFELGGHSLLAVRVVSRVRQALGVEAEIRDLFVRPVLVDFARGLETAAREEAPAITSVDRTGPIPLSFAQQRLWFLEQLGELGSTYHIAARLRLKGELDRDALAFALDRIVARHEALRTTFREVDGVAEQRIAPAEANGFTLVEHDLGGVADARTELQRLVSEETHAPFDLERGPLIRGRLIRLAADDHALLVTMHHIVSDGWSMGVLLGELSALYAARVQGREADLSELPIQYADYAAWQRGWIRGELLERQASYWERALGGAPELLELPTDRARPRKQEIAGDSVAVELDEALTASLRTLSQRHGATLFMTLLAGWATVLARLSGQDDVVVGTPSANRGHAEIEGLIGFFVNMLPVRVELSDSPTVAGLLAQVKTRALEGQRNQDIPFEQVVERMRPVRSLAHTPLFQVMFAWQNAVGSHLELPGLALGPVHPAGPGESPPHETAKFDLTLTLVESGDRIVGGLNYATALFDRETVERWVGYLRRVLEEMAADEHRPVGRLALVPESERARVLEEWGRAEAVEPGASCVHALFEARVARTPGAAAVVAGRDRLTYAELNAAANRLARRLRAAGVGPEARVGVMLERSAELVVALLAVLKAGGAYLPLDPALPAGRRAGMLADAGAAVLVTREPAPEGFAGTVVSPAEADGEDGDDLGLDVPAAALAYVIYTSGSTGTPKGVGVAHAEAAAHCRAAAAAYGLSPADRVLQFAAAGFDVSVEQMLAPLSAGACVVLRGNEVPTPLELARQAAEQGLTVVNPPTAYWHQLAADEAALEILARTARLVIAGGEAMSPAAARGWATGPAAGVRLLNGYGPTEAVITCTAYDVPPALPEGAVHVPVGRPLPGRAAYVVDGWMQPAPLGAPGELCIGGMLARGYLGRPAATAQAFVPDPFSPTPGARMYRTGDLARWRVSAEVRECGSAGVDSVPAGSRTDALTHSRTAVLEFLGRRDHQVKVRGYRIELGEIEARLAEHPGVREAVVLAREDAPGDRRLVAYVVGGDTAGAEALRAHLGQTLPAYMVPSAFVQLEQLPLTPNGKLDRGALPAPEGDAHAEREYEAPEGKVEEALAEIWAELLGVERVGRGDDFFMLGGHSILAVQMISRVRQAMEVELPLAALFEAPVLSALADRILDLRLARFDPETLARLAELLRGSGAETA